METKLLKSENLQLKFSVNEAGITYIKGYASVFGGVDVYGDTIAKGAYSKTLESGRKIKMRWNHYGPVIGKWTEIKEDDYGLYVEGELTPGHSVATDVAASLKHNAIDGMSIGYVVIEEAKEGVIRNLKAIDLYEISIVEEPADKSALITSIKSALHDCKTLKQVEALMKSTYGLSIKETNVIVSAIKRVIRDEEHEQKQISELFKQFKITGDKNE